jgi:TRAP-type C4-dicarboxylate transport system permease small subunit
MKTFSDALGRVEDAIAALILAAVLGVVTYELTVRSLFGRSNLWTDELSRVLLIALVYFAAIGVTRDGGHVRVELMIDRLAPRYRAIADKLSDVLCLVLHCRRPGSGSVMCANRSDLVCRLPIPTSLSRSGSHILSSPFALP